MASATAAPRHPKGPTEPEPARGAGPFVRAFLESSVGAKVLVALTGLGLVGFTAFHMIGNLKVFQGPDAVNGYAYFLKHDLGALIWIARAGLLAIFVLHLALAIRLTLRSRAARPVPYQFPGSVQATIASRTMIWSGVAVGLFVLFHLAHFTFGWVHGAEVAPGTVVNYLDLRDAKGRHDVYSMVVAGFRTPWLAAIYVAAQVVLFVHLLHGVQSSFQTLGLKNRRFARAIWAFGWLVALTILVGNVAIVVGVLAGFAPPLYETV
jgi:succinate dehydrogenase / fumarate reductase, cytochrome b subunit